MWYLFGVCKIVFLSLIRPNKQRKMYVSLYWVGWKGRGGRGMCVWGGEVCGGRCVRASALCDSGNGM